MINPDTIFTLNARDIFLLEIAYKQSNTKDVYREINNVFGMFIESLEKKGIDYYNLKNCLIPKKERNEIALVFDASKIKSNYDFLTISKILPLLGGESCHSILTGDFIGEYNNRYKLRDLFQEFLIQINLTYYQYHNQYFLVYINNLSDNMVTNIIESLKHIDYCIGYFDLTFSSKLKTYLSLIITPDLIKCKSIIIKKDPHGTDIFEELDVDLACDYKELGYDCKFIHSIYYDIFLSYKIEREVIKEFEHDAKYSINALTEKVVKLHECEVYIDKDKFNYLLSNKTGTLKKAGIINLTIEGLKGIIKSKIYSSYIYNLTFLENCETLKFNILIEAPRVDTKNPIKLIVALEYIPREKILRLITMF